MSRFKLNGIDKLKKGMLDATKLDAARKIVKVNGAEMNAGAVEKVPVDTGNLKRSVGMELKNNGLTTNVKANADYAPYVEWGTRFMEAQPFLKPAFNKQKEQFKRDIGRLVK